MLRAVTIAVLFICFVFPLRANLMVMRNLDNGSGMLDAQVNCIMKDSKGFIWIGTRNTLQRFDGVQFRCHHFPGAAAEKVFVILEVSHNDFLVGTNRGLWKYEARSGTLTRVFTEIDFPVRALCLMDGKVYAGTSNGVYIINEQQGIEHLRITGEIPSYSHIIGAYATDKEIWFLSPEGLTGYNPATGGIRVYDPKAGTAIKFSCITGDGKRLYLGTAAHGIVAFDMLSGQYSSFIPSIGNNQVTALCLQHDILCCGTSGSGIFFISPQEKSIVHSINTTPNDDGEYLTSDIVSCLLVDDMNVVWIGSTRFTGLDCLQYRNKPFSLYRGGSREMQGRIFDCLYIEGDIKLLGTPNGFYYVNDSKRLLRYYNASAEGAQLGSVRSFIRYNEDILIGTGGGGAYRLNTETLQLNKFTDIDVGTVHSFTIDKQGKLWLAAQSGLYCYNKQLKPEKVYTGLNSSLVDGTVYCLYIDSKDRYWVATDKGLQFLDAAQGIFSNEALPAELKELPPVTSMMEDRQGNFLFCFNRNRAFICDSTFTNLRYVCTPEDAGYLGYSIREVLQDRNNNYWLVGSRGVVRGDSTLTHFTLFSSTEGLPEPYSNDGQLCGDTIWLSTSKGIVYADIHSIPRSAPTVISDFQVNGVSMINVYEEVMDKGGVIDLPDDHNTLDISFVTLTYDLPELMIYECRLEGYDKEWQILRGINTVKYSNLPSGNYTFKVRKQMDENSVQSFHIKIGSSLSALWWGLVALAGVLLAGGGYLCFGRKGGNTNRQSKPVHQEEEKYRFNKKISEEDAQALIARLNAYMENERAFLNPDLKLAHMAQAMGTSTQTLSQIFNVNLKTRYYDFVNQYRINEFKRLVSSNDKDRYTLKALASLCGFSSYTTFFRAFKEATGITPNEYMQQPEVSGK